MSKHIGGRIQRRRPRRSIIAALITLMSAVVVLTNTSAANAGLIATHRIGAGDTIGDNLTCRNQIITYFGTATSTSIRISKLEIRNLSGQLTTFGGEFRQEGRNGKAWFLPGFSSGPSQSTKVITVNQTFNYSRTSGFTLNLRSSSFGCGGREESVRFVSR